MSDEVKEVSDEAPKGSEVAIGKAFVSLDKDRSNALTLLDIRAATDGKTAIKIAALLHAKDRDWDANGNGTISSSEFVEYYEHHWSDFQKDFPGFYEPRP
ncbi:hypothetical protein OG393_01140 [Streptomyces sp. NBC_01216]|uniref:EF-hand domain-containing protein n=1 Tax=Streptomyces sp. NBC_01216 TaxID=2903778 RepID=UPI002E0E27ED|nr:hypothetical protein OG393_01140 [Streptomyces sp. NBC_01216]